MCFCFFFPSFADATHKWQKMASAHIARHFSVDSSSGRKWQQPVAKNVILFIGDGMGLTTVTAARILKGQLEAAAEQENNENWAVHEEQTEWTQSAEEGQLSFENFEHVALSKVS